MMTVSEEPGNAREHRRLASLAALTSRGIRQGFFRAGHKMSADARLNLIKAPKTGRLYKIRGRKQLHRASAPGESPANLTGALKKSVAFKIQGMEHFEFGYDDSTKYGRRLELGDRPGKKPPRIEARPNLAKVVKENQRNMKQYMNTAIHAEHMQTR